MADREAGGQRPGGGAQGGVERAGRPGQDAQGRVGVAGGELGDGGGVELPGLGGDSVEVGIAAGELVAAGAAGGRVAQQLLDLGGVLDDPRPTRPAAGGCAGGLAGRGPGCVVPRRQSFPSSSPA